MLSCRKCNKDCIAFSQTNKKFSMGSFGNCRLTKKPISLNQACDAKRKDSTEISTIVNKPGKYVLSNIDIAREVLGLFPSNLSVEFLSDDLIHGSGMKRNMVLTDAIKVLVNKNPDKGIVVLEKKTTRMKVYKVGFLQDRGPYTILANMFYLDNPDIFRESILTKIRKEITWKLLLI